MANSKKIIPEEIKRPRGTPDVWGEEWRCLDRIKSTAEAAYSQGGYGRISTPVFEETTLFSRGVGETTDIVSKEMYSFEDKGGHSLTLRPEGTAPVVRAYLEDGMESLPHPVRLYYFEPMFRYDRPQAGRYRQFYQHGAEVIGEISPLVDAEGIALAWRIYRNLGLEGVSLQVGSVGCPNCRPKYTRELQEYYEQRLDEICPDCRGRLKSNPMRLLDCKEDEHLKLEAPQILDHLCRECHGHFSALLEHLDDLDLTYELNPRLVRGLDYYTKTTFELWGGREGAQNALVGGGRYDGLVELLGGKPTPAIGFSGGIERAVLELESEGRQIEPTPPVSVFVTQIGEAARKRAFRLLHELLDAGIGSVADQGKESIKAQMKSADRWGARFALIIGQKEVFDSSVIIRDMKTGVQDVVPSSEIVSEIRGRIG